MRTVILIAVVVLLLLVLVLAAAWKTDAGPRSTLQRDVAQFETDSSPDALLQPPLRSADPEVPARAVEVAVAPTPHFSTHVTSKPAEYDSEEPPGWFDQPQRRILGNVRSRRDGRPIVGATITFSDSVTTTFSSSSDASGAYEAYTEAAPYSLTCRAIGWQSSSRPVTASGTETRVDFDLEPVTEMIVRLQDRAGRPLFESLTELDLEAARALRPVFVGAAVGRGERLSGNVISMRAACIGDTHTDAWYRVNLDSDASGSCCLMLGDRIVDAAPFSSRSSEIVLVASREDIQSSTGSLRFTIVDTQTGALIPNLFVRITPSAGAVRTVKPDLRGGVLVDGLPEGDTKVEIWIDKVRDASSPRAGFASWTTGRSVSAETVVIHAGRVTDMGRKSVEHIVSISGWVDALPDGDKSARVFATHEDENGSVRVEETTPDAHGKFTFSGLKSGFYRVGCHMLPNAQTVLVDARFADVEGVHIAASADDLKSTSR
jgi:hypothetical protein